MEGSVQKKIRTEKLASKTDDEATQSNENTLDSSIYLTYDILRIVFQYLDARDLARVSMVCRSWLEAANNEKCTRGPCCFLQLYKGLQDVSCHIKRVRVKPAAGFFFIPDNAPPRIVEEKIKALLPKHCEAIMLFSTAIILDREMEYYSDPCIACAFLPKIPNVKIKLFEMTISSYQRTIKANYHEIINKIKTNLKAVKTSKTNHKTCFMLFCNYVGQAMAKRCAAAIQESNENEVVSVWGGVLHDIQTHHIGNSNKKQPRKRLLQTPDVPHCIAVLINGPIQTWSTILEDKCNTKEQVEARLKLFKDEVKLKKHSIGFMFVCKARGNQMYNEANVESTIFKRLFPNVPLAGCFGYGEFGKNTVVNEEKSSQEEDKCEKSKSWYNEFSTVFLILTYG